MNQQGYKVLRQGGVDDWSCPCLQLVPLTHGFLEGTSIKAIRNRGVFPFP
uniref:Uncharacterized protein n=1 Tax=Erwinia phage Fifi051 TaxID=3238787 RepID=A0AB39ACE7_9CAUD